jgi:hypothetical protein
MANARSEPIATANRLSSFTFPPPPKGLGRITLESDPHLGDHAAVWGVSRSDDKTPIVPTLKRVLSRRKGDMGDSQHVGEESICPE